MNTVQEQQTVRPRPMASEREFITPEVNIYETKEGYVLEAEMPGVNKEGLEVTVEGNALTLTGHRKEAFDLPNAQRLYGESRIADFRRTFELAPAIDAAKISAKMEQGILTLTLPKAEKVKPRKITVGE